MLLYYNRSPTPLLTLEWRPPLMMSSWTPYSATIRERGSLDKVDELPDTLVEPNRVDKCLNRGKLSYPYCCEDSSYRVVALDLQVIYSVITRYKLSRGKLSRGKLSCYPKNYCESFNKTSSVVGHVHPTMYIIKEYERI